MYNVNFGGWMQTTCLFPSHADKNNTKASSKSLAGHLFTEDTSLLDTRIHFVRPVRFKDLTFNNVQIQDLQSKQNLTDVKSTLGESAKFLCVHYANVIIIIIIIIMLLHSEN